MTTITLKIKEVNDGETTVRKVQHEVERIKLYQFTATIRIVKDILVSLNEQGALKDLLETTFAPDPKQNKELDQKKVEEMLTQLDNKFMINAIEAFKELAVTIPEKFVKLVSVLSGVEREVLERQDLFDVLDIFDAIIEVNDLDALFTRLKKSLGATVNGLKFLQKKREATAK
jgi:LytS/YehU family sensor histidine kinase